MSGGLERLWSQRTAASLARGGGFEPRSSMNAEVGYGLSAWRRLLKPYTGFTLHESGGETRLVRARFELSERLTMSLVGDRKEREDLEKSVHCVALKGSLRW